MDSFLEGIFKEKNSWLSLRKNYKDEDNFVKACISKIDGLRILQFLRQRQEFTEMSDEECLLGYLKEFRQEIPFRDFLQKNSEFSFDNSAIAVLTDLRDLLFEKEMKLREKWTNCKS